MKAAKMETVIVKNFNEQDDAMLVPHQAEVAVDESEEGSVLMSVSSNVILRLNEMGTLIWQVLEEGRDKGGLEVDEVLHRLVPVLECRLTEPVPRRRVKRDVLSFLDTLHQKKLVEVIDKSHAKRLYLVPGGIFWSKKQDTTSLSTAASTVERSDG
ncbi:MAG TPA: PqqD family protein, partial [Pyrinomonadaceae bacterium]|nr:PqqD family protein [Pyrinomonadaceae bacterium]